MAEELRKSVFNEELITHLSDTFSREMSSFDQKAFHELVFQQDWENLALKERMRRITLSMHEVLPADYEEALHILYKAAPTVGGLQGTVFPDYVELYGLNDWEASIKALAFFTPFSTSEFAVRPFLIQDQKRMLQQMIEWAGDENHHIRRLASEGSRPRLPWGQSVPALKQDPKQTLPILEQLKRDESLYVRKSVANHLNDISYIEKDWMLDVMKSWYGKDAKTDWIVKHACRSLLKKGDSEALSLFGYGDDPGVIVTGLGLHPHTITIGDSIDFSFELSVEKPMPLRIEYGIHYVKAKGNRTQKVFMLKNVQAKAGQTLTVTKKHGFKDLSTRKHYSGTHTLSVIVNGVVKAEADFVIE
ncbi:DNA alkylation repair protein [Priestia megaterium]|uniref:DNA alkylation repair protein n=1 Tax=Priestia megaterium TaxID=1404 RepID=UPI002D7FCB4E|nr:DNA alkylation repair protein [Priestia megaterium]MEB4857340.1 DNA alkylation repair protein [Priestia megaterium]